MCLISAGYGGLYWDCSLADEKELQYPLNKKKKRYNQAHSRSHTSALRPLCCVPHAVHIPKTHSNTAE